MIFSKKISFLFRSTMALFKRGRERRIKREEISKIGENREELGGGATN